MIILEAQVPETLGNRLQPLSFRLVPECIVRICAIDDLAEQHQGRITGKVILLEYGLKRALFPVVSQFYIFYIVGYSSFACSYLHHFVTWHKQEFGILIHKLFDEPGAGHAVYFDSFSCNPLHEMFLPSKYYSSDGSETNCAYSAS